MSLKRKKYIDRFSKIIFSEKQIAKRINEISTNINRDYADKENDGIVVISVLNGSVMFMTDLIRRINLDIQIDFITVSSYKKVVKSSGNIVIEKDILFNVKNKHVIIVEDIVDSGLTLNFLFDHFKSKGAASIEACVLLVKEFNRNNNFIKYVGFNCPDEFVVGYGLDYAQKYRNLPFITSLEYELKE